MGGCEFSLQTVCTPLYSLFHMTKTIPTSKRALIAPINRVLIHDNGKQLRAVRGQSAKEQFGDYYIINGRHGYQVVFDYRVDLEQLGRRLGVLKDYEKLEKE